MTMTVVVTRNAPERYRGFLASCMLEIAPGVYSAPRMTRGVRERVWEVCVEWAPALPDDGGVLMTWRDPREPGGQAVRMVGWPKQDFVEHDGIWLAKRELSPLPNAAAAAAMTTE